MIIFLPWPWMHQDSLTVVVDKLCTLLPLLDQASTFYNAIQSLAKYYYCKIIFDQKKYCLFFLTTNLYSVTVLIHHNWKEKHFLIFVSSAHAVLYIGIIAYIEGSYYCYNNFVFLPLEHNNFTLYWWFDYYYKQYCDL